MLNAALAAEGMSPQDGAPADLIRNYFDQTTAGPGTPTVRDKLILEVNDTIEELLFQRIRLSELDISRLC